MISHCWIRLMHSHSWNSRCIFAWDRIVVGRATTWNIAKGELSVSCGANVKGSSIQNLVEQSHCTVAVVSCQAWCKFRLGNWRTARHNNVHGRWFKSLHHQLLTQSVWRSESLTPTGKRKTDLFTGRQDQQGPWSQCLQNCNLLHCNIWWDMCNCS
jgi:hypothetical protein